MLGRYSSEIRTGCANERPSGSVRGAISDDCPYRDRQPATHSHWHYVLWAVPTGAAQPNKVTNGRVENRRSGFSLPVAVGVLSHCPPHSGLAWLCFLFPLIEPDRRSYRIRLSEKTHDVPCDAVCNC
jgi:hypothetical protein